MDDKAIFFCYSFFDGGSYEKSWNFLYYYTFVRGGLFTSCENFFSGAELRSEIENQVAYANATPIDIFVTASKGNISPSEGTYPKKKTDSEYIKFEPFADYAFIRWQIYDRATDTEIPNGKYITIDDISSESTTYTLTTLPENKDIQLAIRPIIAERAQIISYSPMYVSEGVLKDTTIQVLFDRDMDANSIYYTKKEIVSLNESGIAYDNFLPSVTEEELSDTGTLGNHYGYKKGNEVFFKNISIKDNETSANLNYCFDAPYFENARTLSINVKKDGSNNVSIVDYSRLLVTIEKDFFYNEKVDEISSKQVTLSGIRKWMYQVNDETDRVFPAIANASSDLVVKINGSPISSAATHSISNTTPFNNEKKIALTLKTTDTGSGPASQFYVNLQRVQNSSYTDVTEDATQKSVSYQRVTSQNGIFNREIDLADLFGELSDGMYRVNFELKDRSGNAKTYPENTYYYFAVDKVNTANAPTIIDNSQNDSSSKLNLSWTQTNDLAKTVITYKKSSDSSWSSPVTINRGTSNKEFSNLAPATEYDFEIEYTDFANNTITKTANITTATLDSISVSGTPSQTFYFTGASFNKSGLTVTGKLSNGKTWTIASSKWSTDYNTSSYGINKNVNVTYTSCGITKTAKINATYNVARATAITESPVHTSGAYYQFGNFPQTLKSNSVSLTSSPIYKGYGSSTNNWYLGSDGWFYEKCQEKACTIGSIYYVSTGTKVSNASENSYKYFKIEPITWKKLTDNYNGYKLLIATKSIYSGIPFYSSTSNRTISGKTIYPNNYKYSTIRAYLNGSDYETGDNQQTSYSGKGFLQTAFSTTAQGKIQTVTLDNNSEFKSGYPYYNYSYPYSCDNTQDKVFLLGMKEMINTSYGFSDYYYYNYGSNDCDERTRYPTDYALASGHYRNVDTSYANYHLRTAAYGDSNSSKVWEVLGKGDVRTSGEVSKSYYGIVPALCVSTLP